MSLNKLLEEMLEEHIKRVEETDDSWIIEYGKAEEDIEEMSVTGAGEVYNTPKAFKKSDDEDEVNESTFKKMAKLSFINEARYTDYKRDESMSSKRKVNKAVFEINSKLHKIEQIINQNIKLKTEDGVDSNAYWKSTRSNLNKISEKMMRISEKIRKF
tara:strand:+ start:14830 stop:15303 length:474 start_codon:yes stop_codon:yes gene_type:complete